MTVSLCNIGYHAVSYTHLDVYKRQYILRLTVPLSHHKYHGYFHNKNYLLDIGHKTPTYDNIRFRQSQMFKNYFYKSYDYCGKNNSSLTTNEITKVFTTRKILPRNSKIVQRRWKNFKGGDATP